MTTRRATRRVSVAIVVLVAASLGGATYLHNARTLSVEAFASQYAAADAYGRESLAEQYLAQYPAPVVLEAVEKKFSDRVCHSEAHAIGRAIYKRNPNFADGIRQCGSACTYGCFHGVLMQMFGTDSDSLGGVIEDESPEQYLAHVRDTARNLCTQQQVHDAVRLRYCYHGLGHVFQSTQGDVSRALESCHMWAGTPAEGTCATGVFMEYLFATSSAAVLNTKGVEPCDAYPHYKNWCYHFKAYGWIHAWGDAHRALHGCDAFGADTLTCIRYVAEVQATRTLIYADADIDALCGELDGAKQNACVTGVMIRNFDLNEGQDAAHSCDLVTGRYHQRCLDDVRAYSSRSFAE